MTDAGREIVVSGATGFLGSALVEHLVARGHRVRALARAPESQPEVPGVGWFACELPEQVGPRAFEGASCLVHCAWDTRFRSPTRARSVNLEGSRRIFGIARSCGVERIVFVSSLSSHAQAVSVYARTKLEVEGLLDPERDAALRVGQVIGPGGVFWRQAQQIARLPFIPTFFGGRQQLQTVDREDVCAALRTLAEGTLSGVLSYAEVEPVALRALYASVAASLGKPARFVPFPGALALAALRTAERLGFRLPLSSDNLQGLQQLRAFDVAADVQRIGVPPRTMQESLAGIPWQKLART